MAKTYVDMKIGPINIWFDWIALFPLKAYPKFSFFNGGKYWKFSIYWFKYLLEFSGPKRDKTVYKKVTSEELDKILKDLK
jgi:hypothetical protein